MSAAQGEKGGMQLTVVGCGDAFGSGGRMQTCFHVAAGEKQFLIDCGATTMVGMQRLGLDPDRVSTIFVTHLHGDHFGGLVWFLLHAHYVTRRTAPLTIVGPAGIAHRFTVAAEALFPDSTQIKRRFEMRFIEHAEAVPLEIGGVRVTPFEVLHPSGAPPYALRLEANGVVLGFSGDTRWVESLLPTAYGADLFIAESFGFEEQVGYHMTWRDIERNLDRLNARRVLLTHMSGEMLAQRQRVTDPRVLLAEDGMRIDL
jgi:ribonuclease BN (tRNA processing enzyme)